MAATPSPHHQEDTLPLLSLDTHNPPLRRRLKRRASDSSLLSAHTVKTQKTDATVTSRHTQSTYFRAGSVEVQELSLELALALPVRGKPPVKRRGGEEGMLKGIEEVVDGDGGGLVECGMVRSREDMFGMDRWREGERERDGGKGMLPVPRDMAFYAGRTSRQRREDSEGPGATVYLTSEEQRGRMEAALRGKLWIEENVERMSAKRDGGLQALEEQRKEEEEMDEMDIDYDDELTIIGDYIEASPTPTPSDKDRQPPIFLINSSSNDASTSSFTSTTSFTSTLGLPSGIDDWVLASHGPYTQAAASIPASPAHAFSPYAGEDDGDEGDEAMDQGGW